MLGAYRATRGQSGRRGALRFRWNQPRPRRRPWAGADPKTTPNSGIRKKMALRNGSTPPPDPRVHPEHRFRRRAGMAAGSPSTGTNRFRPSITQLIELSDGCILMVWCIKLNSQLVNCSTPLLGGYRAIRGQAGRREARLFRWNQPQPWRGPWAGMGLNRTGNLVN